MTSPATQVRGGRQKTWTRDKLQTALRRYAELYEADFTSAAFNPATAKWQDRPEYIDRYYAGDPEGIGAWPSLNVIRKEFGSFNAARESVGLAPNKTGPHSRRRPDHEHKPIRDVSHAEATRVVFREKSDEATLARLERAERRVERLQAKADRLEAEVRTLRRRKPKTVTQTKTKVKVVREKDLAALTAAKAQAKEARQAASKAASQLERAEAKAQTTIRDLRRKVLTQSTELYEARKRVAAAEGEVKEIEVVREVERVVERVVEMPAPEQAVIDAALRDAHRARQEANAAERRAEKSDALYYALAEAASGEPRRLTPGELRELRASGPAGPAVLAAALKGLAGARAGKGDMRAALTAVASAALSWRDRL